MPEPSKQQQVLWCAATGMLVTLCVALGHTREAAAQSAFEQVASSAIAQQKTSVSGALGDSFKLLLIEHGVRIAFQEKTRRQLAGPFWKDYRRSVHVPAHWEDTDSWLVNYIGHPIHGAAAGFIWIDHGPPRKAPLGFGWSYWASRGRAAAFVAAYSFQFEIGPLSEASIGNVGLRPETTGWVDFAVTPGAGFGLIAAEDLLDRYLVEWVEKHAGNRVARATLRMLFNPSRTLANLAQNRAPWHRGDRALSWR